MYENIIYVSVAIKLQSSAKITNELISEVISEMDYNFSYNENGVSIKDTEIKELLKIV